MSRREACVVWCTAEVPEELRTALCNREVRLMHARDGFAALGALCREHGPKGPPPSLVIVAGEGGSAPERAGEVLRAQEVYAPRSVAWAFTPAGGLRGVSSRWLADDDARGAEAEAEARVETRLETPGGQGRAGGTGGPRGAGGPSDSRLRLTGDPEDGQQDRDEEPAGDSLSHQLTEEELSMLLAPPDEWEAR